VNNVQQDILSRGVRKLNFWKYEFYHLSNRTSPEKKEEKRRRREEEKQKLRVSRMLKKEKWPKATRNLFSSYLLIFFSSAFPGVRKHRNSNVP
jgi:hypothetical protein